MLHCLGQDHDCLTRYIALLSAGYNSPVGLLLIALPGPYPNTGYANLCPDAVQIASITPMSAPYKTVLQIAQLYFQSASINRY